MKKIRLTPEKELYNFCTPYIIAEIGSNHNGDMILAKEMILSAKASNAVLLNKLICEMGTYKPSSKEKRACLIVNG